MKAVLLAGGLGTRLRPLTLNTPKSIVPIFDRPFLHYQIDLLRHVPEVDEIILSLNYQPDRIERIMGDGSAAGVRLRYLVEPEPLGTAGAIKFAEPYLDGSVIVFNGDVLTDIDLAAVVRLHRARRARSTIVLAAVDNPSAYGLVETDGEGNVRRFLEKPSAQEISCNTINAGIYVLEPETFDRIPAATNWSIERKYFPSLVERAETFVAYVHQGYWLDIGTPAQYIRAHRDIMAGRFNAVPFHGRPAAALCVAADARVAVDAELRGPCFVAAGSVVEAGARLAPYSVIGPACRIGKDVVIDGAILWAGTQVEEAATVRDAVVGRGCRIGDHAVVNAGAVLGDGSIVTSYSRTRG
jgi:NDP-sugar pyrophosphorylase family protein